MIKNRILFTFIGFKVAFLSSVYSADYTWTGGGVNPNDFSAAENWNGRAPTDEDLLIFPEGSNLVGTTNDLLVKTIKMFDTSPTKVTLNQGTVQLIGTGKGARGNMQLFGSGNEFVVSNSGKLDIGWDLLVGQAALPDPSGLIVQDGGNVSIRNDAYLVAKDNKNSTIRHSFFALSGANATATVGNDFTMGLMTGGRATLVLDGGDQSVATSPSLTIGKSLIINPQGVQSNASTFDFTFARDGFRAMTVGQAGSGADGWVANTSENSLIFNIDLSGVDAGVLGSSYTLIEFLGDLTSFDSGETQHSLNVVGLNDGQFAILVFDDDKKQIRVSIPEPSMWACALLALCRVLVRRSRRD